MTEPFAHTSGPVQARIVLVGEAFGETEDLHGKPFIGYSGKELWRLLGEAFPDVDPERHRFIRQCMNSESLFIKERESWLASASILMTNVLALRPPNNNLEALCVAKKDLPSDYTLTPVARGKYLDPRYICELERLYEEIRSAAPNIVVALGATALWALSGATNIGAVRGTTNWSDRTGAGVKYLPTYHPAAIMRQWNWRVIVLADLMKARRQSAFAEMRRPERRVHIVETYDDLTFYYVRRLVDAPRLAVDIETRRGQITMIGFAPSASEALVVPFINEAPPWNYWRDLKLEQDVWHVVREILNSPCEKVFQNGMYDLQYLWRYGIRPRNCIHDTMLLHHAMFPEMQKSLSFMASHLSDESPWKLMRTAKEIIKRDE